MKMEKTYESRNVCIRSVNLVRTLPGPINGARQSKTPLEFFQLFISDQILDIVVTNTNMFIGTIANNYQRERACRPTEKIEIFAFLGLLILAGFFRSGRQNREDLFI